MKLRYILSALSIILLAAFPGIAENKKAARVLLWSEQTEPRNVYPQGISGALADYFKTVKGLEPKTANLSDPDAGVPEAILDQTDVLIWYGHTKHNAVPDDAVRRIVQHVKEKGMGFIALHSSHFSKPLKALLNDEGSWSSYVDIGQPEEIWVVLPDHPIARGLKDFTVPKTEIYTEPFKVPEPEAVVLEGTWKSGHRSRECMVWTVGKGRVIYLRVGHEGYPIFYMPEMQRLAVNMTEWAAGKTTAKKNLKKRSAGPAATIVGPYKALPAK
jgi:trehalose utilization protein